jgi:hypothetical protein
MGHNPWIEIHGYAWNRRDATQNHPNSSRRYVTQLNAGFRRAATPDA